MSYVLEALKRAEAERRRGGVPDLQAQQSLPAPEDDLRPAPTRSPWRWVGASAALLVAAGLGAWWARPSPDAAPSVGEAAQEAQPSPPVPVPTAPPRVATAPAPVPPVSPVTVSPPVAPPAPVPAPVAPPRAPSPPPAGVNPAPPVARPPAVVPTPPPAPAAPPAVAPAPTPAPSVAPAPAPSVAPAPVPPVATVPPPAAASAERLPSLAELPEALRRELPALSVGGAMYSEQPAQRMLVLNGQVLRERDTVAPGLVLEQIRLRSAVMNYKGQRWLLGW